MFGPALLFLGMLVFFYGAIAFYLEGRFLPGSEINGYDVSLMNRTEAETLLRDGLIRDYVLRIFRQRSRSFLRGSATRRRRFRRF